MMHVVEKKMGIFLLEVNAQIDSSSIIKIIS